MFIKAIEVTNWKCYAKKTMFGFETFELINRRNGTGKTSLFEAIIFAIWGKLPVGFNMNTVRNDYSKPCDITIWFQSTIESTPCEVRIVRRFYPSSAELYVDDQLHLESVRAVDEYMNSLMDYKIVSQFWTNTLIDSNISSSSYFTNTILQPVLEDAIALQTEFKRRVYQNNRIINAFRNDPSLDDVEGIKQEMEELQKNLRRNVPVDISKAKAAKAAADRATELTPFVPYGLRVMALNEIRNIHSKWKGAYASLQQNEKRLGKELEKQVSSYSKYQMSTVRMMLESSKSDCKCALCHQDLTNEQVRSLQTELDNSGRSEEMIKQLSDEIALAKRYDPDMMQKLSQWVDCMTVVNSCSNYETLIQEYDAENSQNWDRFNVLQVQYAKAVAQRERANEIQKLKIENKQSSEKLEVISQWIRDASSYYVRSITEKASDYLRSMNGRYFGIHEYEGSFQVEVMDENLAINLVPVSRLSNGEKTMCSLSLLFAVHSVMLPDLPLLFDETFSALDHENLHAIQSFLKKVKGTQIFVITHDMSWQEL